MRSQIKTNRNGGGPTLEFQARIEVDTCLILTEVTVV